MRTKLQVVAIDISGFTSGIGKSGKKSKLFLLFQRAHSETSSLALTIFEKETLLFKSLHPFWAGRLDQMITVVPSSLIHSVILLNQKSQHFLCNSFFQKICTELSSATGYLLPWLSRGHPFCPLGREKRLGNWRRKYLYRTVLWNKDFLIHPYNPSVLYADSVVFREELAKDSLLYQYCDIAREMFIYLKKIF